MSSYSPAGCHVTLTRAETTVWALGTWLEIAAAKRPERVAIEYRDRTVTYAQLLARAADAAPPSGARVALEQTDPLEFAVALHSCLLAGAAAVPIDSRLGDAERAVR